MSNVLISYVIPTIHILACLFLIVVVLLQTGKGADMGAVFGGGSQTLFGSGGAGNFLTRLTTATAIIFMVTSLVLTYGQTPGTSSGLLEKLPPPAAPEAPAPDTAVPPVPGADAPAPGAPGADAGAPAEAPVANAPEAQAPAAETPTATPNAGTQANPAAPSQPAAPTPPPAPEKK